MVFFKKEKEVIELILKHLNLVEDTLKTGLRSIQVYLDALCSLDACWFDVIPNIGYLGRGLITSYHEPA